METNSIYLVTGLASEAYAEDGFDAMIAEVEDYNGSIERIEFDSEKERIAFCNGLEFAANNCGRFYVIDDDDDVKKLALKL